MPTCQGIMPWSLAEGSMDIVNLEACNLDIPFEYRFTCWFCGEGSYQTIVASVSTHQQHYLVNMPICDECQSYQCHRVANSLTSIEKLIKAKIVKCSVKELAIGANWTEKELQASDLNGSAFDGFKKSGWRMYLIAKERKTLRQYRKPTFIQFMTGYKNHFWPQA